MSNYNKLLTVIFSSVFFLIFLVFFITWFFFNLIASKIDYKGKIIINDYKICKELNVTAKDGACTIESNNIKQNASGWSFVKDGKKYEIKNDNVSLVMIEYEK